MSMSKWSLFTERSVFPIPLYIHVSQFSQLSKPQVETTALQYVRWGLDDSLSEYLDQLISRALDNCVVT